MLGTDAGVKRWRTNLAYSAGLFAACLAVVIYACGDGELVRISKASFAKPVCWAQIEVVRNPLSPAPKRDLCIYRVIDPLER
jgi:hypothetical protein